MECQNKSVEGANRVDYSPSRDSTLTSEVLSPSESEYLITLATWTQVRISTTASLDIARVTTEISTARGISKLKLSRSVFMLSQKQRSRKTGALL